MLERLRIAINEVLTNGKIPAKVVAERMGIPLSTLYSYGEVGPTGRDIPVKRLKDLVRAAEDLRPVIVVAEDVGLACFQLPTGSAGVVNSALLDSVKESGEAIAQIAKDIQDGNIDEPKRAVREIDEAIRSFAHLRAAVLGQVNKNHRRKK